MIAPAVTWIAGQVYSFCPGLAYLRGNQVPVLAASAAFGVLLFLLTIPSCYWLANAGELPNRNTRAFHEDLWERRFALVQGAALNRAR